MDSNEVLFGLLIAAVVAFFVAIDAKKRGMNAVGWGIGTFALMIIFLPLYFIMRKPILNQTAAQPLYPPPYPTGPANLCATCGKYYGGTPAFCPNCGAQQGLRPG